MPKIKIQDVGVGNLIRDPRGRKAEDSQGTIVQLLLVVQNDGNSFRCHPVTDLSTTPVTYDLTRFQNICLDTFVERGTR